MNITVAKDNSAVRMTIEGRLDTVTAPELVEQIEALGEFDQLVFDFSKLEYISSAGLRSVLIAQKKSNEINAKFVVENLNEICMNVFEVTGFADIINIR